MNKNVFCSRKGGVTIGDKFYPAATVSQILAKQLERKNDKRSWKNLREKCIRELGPVKGVKLAEQIWASRPR